MAEPFLAEIKIVGFNFAPRGWAFCDGQILPINQNQSLFSLLGTTYGGNGRDNFALPDLRGRSPIHMSSSPPHQLGSKGGEESHVLTEAEMPQHTHTAQATSDPASQQAPAGNLLADNPSTPYAPATNLTSMATGTVANAGSGASHENMSPFLAVYFCIALTGTFPSRN